MDGWNGTLLGGFIFPHLEGTTVFMGAANGTSSTPGSHTSCISVPAFLRG